MSWKIIIGTVNTTTSSARISLRSLSCFETSICRWFQELNNPKADKHEPGLVLIEEKVVVIDWIEDFV